MKPLTVGERLKGLAALFEERNEEYKDNYLRFGKLALAITGPLTLETEDDFNRFALFIQIVAKLTRYGHNFSSGGHPDSLDDFSVYAQMLAQVDEMIGLNAARKGLEKEYDAKNQ